MTLHGRCAITASKSSHCSKNLSPSAHEIKQLHAQKLKSKSNGSDAATWDELIRAYCTHDHPLAKLPFLVYKQMQFQGIRPTQFTFPPLLKSLAACTACSEGMQIHAQAVTSALISNVFIVHSLIAVYGRSAAIGAARQLFDEMSERNCVSWNVMISSYCQNGLFKEALVLFRQMAGSEFGLDRVTMVSVLPACAHLGAIGMGEWIHGRAKEGGVVNCVFLGTALVDMYCKCGFVEKAKEVFDEMPEKNIVTWNAMIGGFAMYGHSDSAFELFNSLTTLSIRPNYVTFIGVLCACTHAGLVEEGRRYFALMREDYLIEPTIQHYACLVDLLGRAGQLVEALELVQTMPFSPDAVIWGALLGACRMHNNIELGERVMGHLVELEPRNCGNYMILSNMYADVGRWDDAAGVASKMRKHGIRKMPGCSWIEVDLEVHQFFVGDRSHPQIKSIYIKLEELQRQLKVVGYVPNTGSALRDMEEEDKEDALKIHSEKLAVAFGLISLNPCAAIRIVKNLRVCIDCHTMMKFVSKIVGRDIIVRDNSRFHHFKDGSCSCVDYW
ncbi:pentatricopeptide repeat-containing protein At5g48910-like [Magnolia sinica]|uniref:pentatricopeptide repeat-containing protein At5g48910-like n=1 Tax=Magnolia sinica TaxID=86752 RepID=UPI00265AE723|nr:pentatricopeptide repeat-containing protein At5g48910-like [Magnolia sinica]